MFHPESRCYVDDTNTCSDSKSSTEGAPYNWSCLACKDRGAFITNIANLDSFWSFHFHCQLNEWWKWTVNSFTESNLLFPAPIATTTLAPDTSSGREWEIRFWFECLKIRTNICLCGSLESHAIKMIGNIDVWSAIWEIKNSPDCLNLEKFYANMTTSNCPVMSMRQLWHTMVVPEIHLDFCLISSDWYFTQKNPV